MQRKPRFEIVFKEKWDDRWSEWFRLGVRFETREAANAYAIRHSAPDFHLEAGRSLKRKPS